MITVRSNIKSITASLDELQRRKVPTATRQALNRAGITLRKEHRNNMARELNPRRKSDVSKAVSLKRATGKRQFIEIITDEFYLGLGQSKDTKVTSFRKGKRRVQRVRFRGRLIKGAFRPKNLRNQQGRQGRSIFVGNPPGKYTTGSRKIRKLFAFSFLQELEKKKIYKEIESVARDRFQIEFARALENQLRKGRRKVDRR
jgi:hypothetical protein